MLKEQVITPRAGRGGAAGGGRGRAGEFAEQRPVKRGGQNGGGQRGASQARRAAKGNALSKALAWMPFVGKALVVVCLVVICFAAYRTAASSSFFQLRTIDVSGVSQASEEKIKASVRRAASAEGVWQADLETISAELERQPWVRQAIVTRVLPSGLRVRITERTARAVVRTSAGRFVWVDDEGVMTGTVAPAQNAPAFFMRGWDESGTESGHAENRRRVEKYLELTREWETAGIASRVSEVNLDDLRDVRAQLTGDDSRIEVRLGRDDLTKRLRQSLEALDEQRATPRGAFITYIDMTQGKRAVIGFKAQAFNQSDDAGERPKESEREDAGTDVADSAPETPTANVAADAPRRAPEVKKPVVQTATRARAEKEKGKEAKKPQAGGNARTSERTTAAGQTRGGIERPRRVGRSG
ncbi:MAG TPA: FtsQ-type POTRA domain-containing protein [Pyrinomonadaceae bacterium]|nr:FtsQ-type POTRA domain-containing protein [Pyrinomonadaceae bacterium]